MYDYTSKPFDPDNDPVAPEQPKILANVTNTWERIEMAREERNLTKSGFAKSIGMTPQGYRGMITGNYLQETVAIAIEYKHGFNKHWLLTGEGEPRVDQWEMIRGEIEDSILRDLNIFFSQKLKRTRPMVHNKDGNVRQVRR